MELLSPELQSYVEAHTSPETPLLQKLNRETNAKVLMPRMLSGHIQGQLLSILSSMIRPKQILEIGTYTGYSAICLASGLDAAGTLHTIDINDELTPMVKQYIADAGLTSRIKVYTGNALQVIPSINEKFDLVFIDADKINYSAYYDLVFDKVKAGGFMIADNVLWSGKVLDQPKDMDADTKAIVAFNKKIHADERVEHLLLPVRDGLMITRKK